MPNVARVLKAHNQKVLKQHQGDSTDQDSATCNCRNKANCPLPGKCQIKSIVYQANVLSEDGASYSYIGLTDNSFKKRWSNHCQSFKNEAHETSTEISKLIWRLKRADMKYTINWQILTKCQSYKPGAKTCNLCLTEKLLIINSPTSINSRTELV